MSNNFRVSNMNASHEMQEVLNNMHQYLMDKGFPYHSVSVIYRPQDLGYHCIFSYIVEDKIDKEIKDYLSSEKFTFSINRPPQK